MQLAQIVPIAAADPHGFAWKWRCVASKAESKQAFSLYYDCVCDARKHGYQVDLPRAHGLTAPGGAAHKLD